MTNCFFSKSCSEYAFFRAAFLFDSMSKRILFFEEETPFLLGVTCVFMAIKLEDETFICMADLLKATGNHFTSKQIQEAEMVVLQAMDSQLYFSTTLDFLDHVFLKNKLHEMKEYGHLREICLSILRMAFLEPSFHDEDQNILAVAVVVRGFSLLFLLGEDSTEKMDPRKKIDHLLEIVKTILAWN